MIRPLIFLTLALTSIQAYSQRMDPSDMVNREKQYLYDHLPNVSTDQKELMEGIYAEFLQSITEYRDDVQSGKMERGKMYENMAKLRDEKNLLMKDLLNDEQYSIYMSMVEKNQKQIEQRRQERQNVTTSPQ